MFIHFLNYIIFIIIVNMFRNVICDIICITGSFSIPVIVCNIKEFIVFIISKQSLVHMVLLSLTTTSPIYL